MAVKTALSAMHPDLTAVSALGRQPRQHRAKRCYWLRTGALAMCALCLETNVRASP